MFTYLLEGADRVAGQLRGDKECPFSGVTKSGRVWRKVPESDARSVISTQTFRRALTASVDSCVEIKSVPLQWRNQIWQSLEDGAGKRCSECGLEPGTMSAAALDGLARSKGREGDRREGGGGSGGGRERRRGGTNGGHDRGGGRAGRGYSKD